MQNQLKINFSGGAANTGGTDGNKNSIFIYNTGIHDGEKSINTDIQRIGDYYAIRIGAESVSAQNLYINRTGLQAATWDKDKNFAPRSLYLNYRGGTVQIGSPMSDTEITTSSNSLTVYSVVGADGAAGADGADDNNWTGEDGRTGEKGRTSLFITGGTGGAGGDGGKSAYDRNRCGRGGAGGTGGAGIIVYGGTGGKGGYAGNIGYSSKDGKGGTGGTGIIVYGGEAGTSPNSLYGSKGNAIEAYGDVIIDGNLFCSGSRFGLVLSTEDATNVECNEITLKIAKGNDTTITAFAPKYQHISVRGGGKDSSKYVYVLFDTDVYPEGSVVFLCGYTRNIKVIADIGTDTDKKPYIAEERNFNNVSILILFGEKFSYNDKEYWKINTSNDSPNFYGIG